MDAGAVDPLRAARPEEGEEKPKPPENQDDGYETSNSGEAARRKPSSAEGSPAPPPEPSPPPDAPYEPLMRYPEPEPEPEPYRHFEPPAPPPLPLPHQPEPHQYQHFPFKYNDPYSYKRDDLPYDMSQHPHQQYGPPPPKRDDDLYNGIKRECEDPYSFVEEEAIVAMLGQGGGGGGHLPPHMHHDHQHPHMMHPQQMMLNQPKKRGRKKKIKDENGMELKTDGLEGALLPRPVKERKKHDRFNGMSEEEVARRTLPDHLAENLDIIIIGINPGLFAAYKGHHYAGPGNHFWKCLYLSGLTREQMSADEDYKLLNFGIGFTNMVPRATKGSADLTRREIKEGSAVLLEKLQTFRPKVAVFNGKLIYEVFSGKKDFCFGKQPDTIAGTNTKGRQTSNNLLNLKWHSSPMDICHNKYMWVMPSSSARCAQLPRAADKVPFYAALKKFRDYLNGLVAHCDEAELVFPDTTGRRPQEEMEIRRYRADRLTMEPEPGDTMILEDGTEVPLKKKRGRPKKVKLENGETAPPVVRAPRQPRAPAQLDPNGEQPPKKKRGRPKKIRPDEQQYLLQQQQQQANSMAQSQSQGQGQLGLGLGLGLGVGVGVGDQGYMPQHAGEFPAQLPSPVGVGGGLLYQHQQNQQQQAMAHADNYFQPQPPNPGMDSPLGALEGGGGMGALGRGYGSPGPQFCASPRAVYASPRSQGYSPSPHRPAGTPQPQPQPQFPSSPAGFNAPSPPRVGSVGGGGGPGPGGYGSPGARGAPFAARSPLYAHSPAHQTYQHPHAIQNQPSPATQNRFSQSPHPHHPHPYSRSPAPQSQVRPYSRSPVPVGGGGGGGGGGTTPFPAASPAGALPAYTPSPAHTPYSHHSSPAPPAPRTPTYTDNAHHYQTQLSDVVGGSGSSVGGSFGGELSSDIGAAISSPAAVALDFEPPRDPDPDPTASPMGSTDMHPGSNSNSSLSDYNKTSGVGEMSPGGTMCGGGGGLYEGDGRMSFAHHPHTHSPHPHTPQHPQHPQHPHNAHLDKREHYHYTQEQGNGVGDSPRLDQLHQHPSMYPSNFNRSTPPGGSSGEPFSPLAGASFRPPEHPHTPHTPHTPHHNPGSPDEYGASGKPKSQDVASKSLSGLESLVDQIPSIAEGPGGATGVGGNPGSVGGGAGTPGPPAEQTSAAPVASLPEYAPALYPPYGAYGGAAYGNNGYGGPFVGYGGVGVGGWGSAVMRPTPGYLSDWQYSYPAYNSPYNNPYAYNGYAAPPPAHHQQTHYLSAPPLIDLHKNGEHSAGVPAVPSVPSVPSVGFGGFC